MVQPNLATGHPLTAEKDHSDRLLRAVLGSFGGLFLHLVIGSLYQWGIISVYITSYYKMSDTSVTLQNNAIAFPLMMICIGLTMRLGLFLSQKTHPLAVLTCTQILSAASIFSSSYVSTIWSFIALYGIVFGLIAGTTFMIPIVEVNKVFPGHKMYINGVILIGTGLGSLVFGLFSYNFLNPDKIPTIDRYYSGDMGLQVILKVPECLRWLSLLYLCIGLIGVLMVFPAILKNRQSQEETVQYPLNQEDQVRVSQLGIVYMFKSTQKNYRPMQKAQQKKPQNEAQSLVEAFCTWQCWIKALINILGSCGVFLINGNYKTYVSNQISDDDFLTTIGVVASVGNGCSRFFWNLLFNKTGYKTVMLLNLSILIVVFAVIRFTVAYRGVYLFMVFLINCNLGGFLVITPTFSQAFFGQRIGSDIYGFYWIVFALANLIQYAYVSQLSTKISFDNVIYICLGMAALAIPLVILTSFEGPWLNDLYHLEYCSSCKPKPQEPTAISNPTPFKPTSSIPITYSQIKFDFEKTQ